MRAVLGIEDLSVYDVDPHAMEKFRRNLEPLGFRIHLAKDCLLYTSLRTMLPVRQLPSSSCRNRTYMLLLVVWRYE